MAFEKIEIPTPRETFMNEIKRQIIKGRMKIGEKLPTERELSQQTGISKSVIHFALKELEHQSFIKIVPRKGFYVTNFLREGSFETLNEILKFNDSKLSYKMSVDMVELRNALEGGALIRLAAHHTPEDIQRLKASVDLLKAAAAGEPSIQELGQMTSEFHYLVCDLSGNDMFALIMNAFGQVSTILWEKCAAFWGAEGFIEQDETIIRLIEEGRGHEAQEYIEGIFAQFIEAFDKERYNSK